MPVIQQLWADVSPPDTPFDGVPITNFSAGVTSDVLQIRIFNDRGDPGSGSVIRDNYIQLVAQNPSIPSQKIKSGIAPLDELWGQIRFINASTNVDPYVTDWLRVGNTSVIVFPAMVADSHRTFELRFSPPSTALTNPYTFFTLIHINERSIGVPGPGVDIHRGVMTGFGDHRQTTLLSGLLVTASVINDDKVDVGSGSVQFQGVEATCAAVQQVTIDEFDGAGPPEELEIGESYILEFTRGSDGLLIVNKGLRSTTPVKPITPLDEIFNANIQIDFVGVGTAPIIGDEDITNSEVYGHHFTRVLTGLTIRLYGGNVFSSGSWRPTFEFEDFILTANEDNYLWSRADGTFSVTLDATLPDTSSDLLYIYTTDATDVTLIDDRRVFIDVIPTDEDPAVIGAMAFANPGGPNGPHIDITVEGVFVGWKDVGGGNPPITTLKVNGGMIADPSNVVSAAFTVPETGWYMTHVVTNGSSNSVNDTLIAKFFVNDVALSSLAEFNVVNNVVDIISSPMFLFLNAGDKIDRRFTNSAGDGTSQITINSSLWIIELKIRGA